MPFEQVEYKFPDEDDDKVVDKADDKADDKPDDDNVEIEVVDDTPVEDRDKKPAPPPEEVTDTELTKYSEDVQKRIKHFTKGYHDERRAKEAAIREREEAVRVAQQLLEENKKLKGTVNTNQQAILESAKKTAQVELDAAKKAYKEAYEAGDAEALANAQEAMTAAKIKVDRLTNFKPPALQQEQTEVQIPQPAQQAAVDPKAESWRAKNTWFGADEEMTAFALGLHKKLVSSGVDPTSTEYYERIDARMRQVFPDQFDLEDPPEAEAKPRAKPVVAPATRSTAPKKIVLTKSQVNLAKRLGVPIDVYAKQVANEMRKQNG